MFVCLFGWLFVCLFVWLVGWLVVWWLFGCCLVVVVVVVAARTKSPFGPAHGASVSYLKVCCTLLEANPPLPFLFGVWC